MTRQLESLDLNLVNILHHVLVERSITAAAERVGLSQPAVSRALGRLRDIYEDPLLVKQGRAMVPTPLAEDLLPLTGQAVEALRHVANAGGRFDPATATGAVRIATKDQLGVSIVETWKKRIRPYAPLLTLDIVNLEASLIPEIVSGKIDLVVMGLNPEIDLPPNVDLDQFVIRPIKTEPYHTILRHNHPIALKYGINRTLSLEDYCALEHILINPMRGKKSSVDDYLDSVGLERRIAYRSQTFMLAKAIMLATDCALTTCDCIIGEHVGDVWIGTPPFPIEPINLMAGWHPNWTLNPRHSWLRKHIIEGLGAPRSLSIAA